MHNLSDFISTFKRGFQQSNRFLCQIIVRPEMIAQIILDEAVRPLDILGFSLPIPVGITDAVISAPQIVDWLARGLLVESARLPDRGFGTVDLSMYGITQHFPYHTDYSSLDCTFLMPYSVNLKNDAGVPRFFTYWQNQIQNITRGPDSGMDFRFPSHYYATILLTLFDRTNSGVITYQFDEAYPSVVESSAVSWASTDEYMKLPVKFTYSYWKVLPLAESLAIGGLDSLLS